MHHIYMYLAGSHVTCNYECLWVRLPEQYRFQ